jgi:hypothetical protein
MSEDAKSRHLKVFLRMYGIVSLILFSILLFNFVIKNPALDTGGSLHWLIWDGVDGHVGPMLFVIYLVWAIFFILAANEPARYAGFLDFTMWANLAHGALMIPMAFDSSHLYHSKFLTDIPFILILAAGIYLLRPSRERSAVGYRHIPGSQHSPPAPSIAGGLNGEP